MVDQRPLIGRVRPWCATAHHCHGCRAYGRTAAHSRDHARPLDDVGRTAIRHCPSRRGADRSSDLRRSMFVSSRWPRREVVGLTVRGVTVASQLFLCRVPPPARHRRCRSDRRAADQSAAAMPTGRGVERRTGTAARSTVTPRTVRPLPLRRAQSRRDSNWIAGGRYFDRLHRRDGQWRIAVRTNVIEWSGMVPTMPLPFADTPDIHGNGRRRAPRRPVYQRPLVNLREKHDPGSARRLHCAMPDEKYQYGIDFERVAPSTSTPMLRSTATATRPMTTTGRGRGESTSRWGQVRCRAWTRWPTSTGGHNTAAVVFTIDAHTE